MQHWMNVPREERVNLIFQDIAAERERQNEKWGVQRHDWPTWITILTEEVGEAAQEALRETFDSADHLTELREELIQVAAVAVQIIEHLDRSRSAYQHMEKDR